MINNRDKLNQSIILNGGIPMKREKVDSNAIVNLVNMILVNVCLLLMIALAFAVLESNEHPMTAPSVRFATAFLQSSMTMSVVIYAEIRVLEHRKEKQREKQQMKAKIIQIRMDERKEAM